MTTARTPWTIRTIQIIVGIAGLGALTLGLLFWIANIELISFHMLFGLIVALSLLVISFVAIFTRGIRIWGIAGIIYALFLPAFGLTQSNILTGNLHWIIQALHMLVGLGAVFLAGTISARYVRIKSANAINAAEDQLDSLRVEN